MVEEERGSKESAIPLNICSNAQQRFIIIIIIPSSSSQDVVAVVVRMEGEWDFGNDDVDDDDSLLAAVS